MTKWLVLPFALTLIACGPPVRGAVDASGFSHRDYALQVASLDKERLMPPDWILDNYFEGEHGGLGPKTGEQYKTSYSFDLDGNGDFEHSADEFLYDLRFKHKKHDGTIFLRTIPLSTNQAEKDLRVLLDRYVEAVAGAGYELAVVGDSPVVVEKRYAAVVTDKKVTKLAGREALLASFDVANIDQVKIDPGARMARVALLMAHTTFKYYPALGNEQVGGSVMTLPVLLLVGYANQPEDFDEGLKDFHEFLGRISIDGKTGYAPLVAEATAKPSEATAKPSEATSKPSEATSKPSETSTDSESNKSTVPEAPTGAEAAGPAGTSADK